MLEPKLSALSVLVFGGPMSLKALANAEQVRPPTMSRIVGGLEQMGLVRREVLRHDRREVRLHPTREGTQTLQRGRKRRIEFLANRLKQLSPAELQTLSDAARHLLALREPE